MLGLAESIKDIKVYQEGLEQGKLMAVLPLANAGLSPEEIATSSELELSAVQKIIQENPNSAPHSLL